MAKKKRTSKSSLTSWGIARFFGSILLIVAVGLALRPFFDAVPAEAESSAGSEALAAPEILLAHQEQSNPSLSTTQSGITISAANFRIEEGRYLVDLCYDKPDKADWTIWQARLDYREHSQNLFGFEAIEIRQPSENGSQQVTRTDENGESVYTTIDVGNAELPGVRCDLLHFDIPEGLALDEATLTIESIAAYPGEGMECQPAYLDKVNEALRSLHADLAADCSSTDLNGGGISGLQISHKPDGMSQEEAETILRSDDLFIMVNGISGPWTFSSGG